MGHAIKMALVEEDLERLPTHPEGARHRRGPDEQALTGRLVDRGRAAGVWLLAARWI